MTICTFNRVEDCLNTLQALADDPEALSRLELVRVVDQGTDPLESRDRFTDVAAGVGPTLRYHDQVPEDDSRRPVLVALIAPCREFATQNAGLITNLAAPRPAEGGSA